MKKRILISIVLSIIAFCLWADDISVVMPTTKDTNYVLYTVSTGVFLRLDTRDGTIIGIAPALVGARVKNKTYRKNSLTTILLPSRHQAFHEIFVSLH